MILSLKVYEEKRKELLNKILDCETVLNEALMTNNWIEYWNLRDIQLKLRHELAMLDKGGSPSDE